MTAPEQAISKTLLRSFVPLGQMSNEQLSVLIDKSELLNLYPKQACIKVGETEKAYYFLIHGQVVLEESSGKETTIISGEEISYQALAHEFPRMATVTALQDSTVLKVESSQLESLLCWGQVAKCLLAEIAVDSEHQDDYVWINKLLESKLFYKVPPNNIRAILSMFTEVAVKKGEEIIKEGDVGTCCYLIKKGNAEIFVNSKGVASVAMVGVGAVIGEDALVTNNPRNASVVMSGDGVLMKLEKQSFYELLKPPIVTMVTPGNIEAFMQTDAALLDVRTEKEYDLGHHGNAVNLPLHLSYLKSALLDKEKQYITYSSSDERAKAAAFLLTQQGFKAFAMQGGIDELPKSQIEQFKVL